MPLKFKSLAITQAFFGIPVAKKLVDFGPVLILKHALRIQLIGLTFYHDAGFCHVGIIESLQVFHRGIFKQYQYAFEALDWLINSNIPQHIRLVDRVHF